MGGGKVRKRNINVPFINDAKEQFSGNLAPV